MEKKSRDLVMAKLYLKNKDYKMAETSFNEYLNSSPEDTNALKLLAQVYEHTKQFDKAFQAYERCYLIEPDRTGVILDICRILLIDLDEGWSENVDHQKWINLATKVFPSNPIVMKLKSSVAVPPASQNNCTPKVNQTGDDPFKKIMEHFKAFEDRLESRLSSIEQKLSNLKISHEAPKATTSPGFLAQPAAPSPAAPTPAAPTTPSLFGRPPAAPTATTTPAPSLFGQPAAASPVITATTTATKSLFGQAAAQPAASTTTTPSLFGRPAASSPAPTAVTTPAPSIFGQPPAAPPVSTTPAPSLFGQPAAPPAPTTTPAPSLFGKPAASSPATTAPKVFGQPATPAQAPSLFGAASGSPFSLSGNPFADSLAKYNLPTEGDWTKNNGTPPKKDEKEAKEEDEVAPTEELPIENTCNLKPIEIKTGEEDDDAVFENRCKLYRFRDKEYKERGLGNIRVLKNRETGNGRLIMRRDQIGLVCLNCWDCKKIERVRDTQVRWVAFDASDDPPQSTVFLVRFKTAELTETFLKHMNELFSEGEGNSSIAAPSGSLTSSQSNSTKQEVEIVSPQVDQKLVEKARELKLPDLFYHNQSNQESNDSRDGCENDDE